MTDPQPAPQDSEQIDHCCDLFEKHWGTEKAFSIEDALSRLPQGRHAAFLKALLPVEIELREGDKPTVEELHSRFPAAIAIVDEILGAPPTVDSLASPSASTENQETLAPKDQADDGNSVAGAGAMRIPRQLGRYRIIRKLGHGAMGSVFLAHDEQLDRQVALKIPRGDMQRNAELRMRFQREAKAAASLDHPNICRIHDIGEFEGIHYICMGYVEGFPLTRYAIAESGLTEQRIAELVLKLAKALGHAHEAGFIHRDLKPANVMMDYEDQPVILDFGLARRTNPNEDTRVTQTGQNVGSPAYMSPEQVDGDQDKITIQTDIYSLGVLLYELLTGRLPFEGSVASVMGQIMTKEPDKPSDYRRDLSVRLENLCLRMIAKDPDKRHPSMHAVAAGLQEYLDKYGDQPTPPKPEPIPKPDSADPATKRREQIEGLIKSGDYARAEKLMVALSRETDDSLVEAATWAATELPRLRKTREEVRAGRQEMYNTASRLMKSHDYEQAAQLLEEYPYDLRTPKMQDLLEDAEQMTFEVKRLRKEIKQLRNQGDNRSLMVTVDMLLEIKPGDRRAKELREKLTRRNAGPITKFLGKRTPSFVEKMSMGLQTALLVVIVALACAIPAYFWSDAFLGPGAGVSQDPPHTRSTDEDNGFDTASGGSNSGTAAEDQQQPIPTVFENARPLRNLNNIGAVNAYPWVSPDGLTIWWTREGGDETSCIYEAKRTSTTAEFGSARLVLSGARLAAITEDGRNMMALSKNDLGFLQNVRSFVRSSVEDTFGFAAEVPSIADLANPKCFSFNDGDCTLIMQNRPEGPGLFRVNRSSPSAAWQAPVPINVTSASGHNDTIIGWGQLIRNGQALLHTQAESGDTSQERAYIADQIDPGRFSNPKRLSIGGDTDRNVRAPRYCEATGELFFTQCTGPLNAPGSKAELWVANTVNVLKTESAGMQGGFLDELQGHWKLVSAVIAGGARTPETLAFMNKQLRIDGDQFQITYNGIDSRARTTVNDERGAVVVTRNTNPIQVDLFYKSKTGRDLVYLGIMKIQGDKLRHRFVKSSMANAVRPKSFDGRVTSGWENEYRRLTRAASSF